MDTSGRSIRVPRVSCITALDGTIPWARGSTTVLRFTTLMCLLFASVVRADGLPPDLPRWRYRVLLASGFGGGRESGSVVAMFPTTLEFGARLFGPLSLSASAVGVLSGDHYVACGQARRPDAALGALGLRADLANGRSAPWVDPFIEVHGGLGGQAGGREHEGNCPAGRVFGTAGTRIGIDAWLGGKVAVTAALTYDYLPIASPIALSIGASVVIY